MLLLQHACGARGVLSDIDIEPVFERGAQTFTRRFLVFHNE